MKLAIVTHTPRPICIDGLFDALRDKAELSVFKAGKDDCKKLHSFLKDLNLSAFDKVVLDLPFKYLRKQAALICTLPDVCIYEEDATQNFIPESKWAGSFTKFYRAIPHAKIINTGAQVSARFRALGVDSFFIAKGFDPGMLWNTNEARTVSLGFIGTLGSTVYQQRKVAIEYMQAHAGLEIFRTQGPEEYRARLNSIDVFFSADIGLGEYMAKNFEAMACGCILLAYRQGSGEEEALGLVDGVNCLLYNNVSEAKARLAFLHQQEAGFVEKMRVASLKHAQLHFSRAHMAEAFWQVILRPPACSAPRTSPMLRLWRRLCGQ
jgi:glycosyltransferase involved in cell wall biosynthesis